MAEERSGAMTNVATTRPAWLDDFLRTREGPTYTTAVRLEPFVSWLGSTDPLEVSRATLLDVMRLWVDSLGIAKTRATVEVVRDLYSSMRESGAPAAGTLWAATDDFLEARLPVIESRTRASSSGTETLAHELRAPAIGCGVMLIGAAIVAAGYAVSTPATINAQGGGFAPVLPLVCGTALATPIALAGFVLLLRAVRRLGTVSARAGWTVRIVVGVLSLVLAVTGLAFGLMLWTQGALPFVLPFAAAGLAGFAGIATVAQSFMGHRA